MTTGRKSLNFEILSSLHGDLDGRLNGLNGSLIEQIVADRLQQFSATVFGNSSLGKL